jgi:putative ABC transport system ATP-binding protein
LVGLASRLQHFPAQLSGGQQQRVAIARALAGEPRFLLADEPTGNLDSHMADSVMSLLHEINSTGTTIIMVTHELELATQAKRNIFVRDGHVSNGEPEIQLAAVAGA